MGIIGAIYYNVHSIRMFWFPYNPCN